jgi:hypothetical protein
MQDQTVRKKIEKLIASGIVQTAWNGVVASKFIFSI